MSDAASSREIGGVWYSDEAYAHMERLYQRLALVPPGTYREKVLTNEAAVLHTFHQEFPGVVMRDGDDA